MVTLKLILIIHLCIGYVYFSLHTMCRTYNYMRLTHERYLLLCLLTSSILFLQVITQRLTYERYLLLCLLTSSILFLQIITQRERERLGSSRKSFEDSWNFGGVICFSLWWKLFLLKVDRTLKSAPKLRNCLFLFFLSASTVFVFLHVLACTIYIYIYIYLMHYAFTYFQN